MRINVAAKRIFAKCTLTLFIFTAAANAAFIEQAGAIKSASLGRSGVAYSDDIESLLTNPAGLARCRDINVSFEYYKPFSGIGGSPTSAVPGYSAVDFLEGFIGIATPAGETGAIGFSWANFTSKGQYSENVFTLGWGRSAAGILDLFEDEEIFFGISLKFMRLSYEQDAYTGALFSRYGNSASGITFDAGLDYEPLARLRFGVAGKNLYSFETGLAGKETLPMEFSAGCQYEPLFMRGVKILAQLSGRSDGLQAVSPSCGAEFAGSDFLRIRAGINSFEFSAGAGLLIMEKAEVNYSVSAPYLLVKPALTHRVGLIYYLR